MIAKQLGYCALTLEYTNLLHNFHLAVNAIVGMHYTGCSVSGDTLQSWL